MIALINRGIEGEVRMNRLSRDTEILAAKLATARGISPEEAVTLALKESLERSEASKTAEPRLRGEALIRCLEEISARYRELPILDHRSPDEILGYDEFGVPS